MKKPQNQNQLNKNKNPRTLTTAAIVRQACPVMRGRKQRSLRRAGQKFEKKNVQLFCTFFPVLRNNFFFCKFLPFYFWNFGEPTVYRILCVEFLPPKFNAFQVFYRKMNAFGFCESCLFSSNIIDLPSFFYKTVPVYHEINAKKNYLKT